MSRRTGSRAVSGFDRSVRRELKRSRQAKHTSLLLEILEPRNLLAADVLLATDLDGSEPAAPLSAAETADSSVSRMGDHHAAMHGGQMAGPDCCRVLPTESYESGVSATVSPTEGHDCCRIGAVSATPDMMAEHACCRTISASSGGELAEFTIEWFFAAEATGAGHDCCRAVLPAAEDVASAPSDAPATAGGHDCCQVATSGAGLEMMISHDCCRTIGALPAEPSTSETDSPANGLASEAAHDCCRAGIAADQSDVMAGHDCCQTHSGPTNAESAASTIDRAVNNGHDCCQTTTVAAQSDVATGHDCCQATTDPTVAESSSPIAGPGVSEGAIGESHDCCQIALSTTSGIVADSAGVPVAGTMQHADTGHTMGTMDNHDCCRTQATPASTAAESARVESANPVLACPVPTTGLSAETDGDDNHAKTAAGSADTHDCCRVPASEAASSSLAAPTGLIMSQEDANADHGCCDIPSVQSQSIGAGWMMTQFDRWEMQGLPEAALGSVGTSLPTAAEITLHDWACAAPAISPAAVDTASSAAASPEMSGASTLQGAEDFSAAVDSLFRDPSLATGLWN